VFGVLLKRSTFSTQLQKCLFIILVTQPQKAMHSTPQLGAMTAWDVTMSEPVTLTLAFATAPCTICLIILLSVGAIIIF
jgi:hypothetical protein